MGNSNYWAILKIIATSYSDKHFNSCRAVVENAMSTGLINELDKFQLLGAIHCVEFQKMDKDTARAKAAACIPTPQPTPIEFVTHEGCGTEKATDFVEKA